MAQIGFLGTGIMGAHMCRNLVAAGHSVCAWNRTASKAQVLATDGVKVVAQAADAVRDCSHVILMLSDGRVCDAVLADGVYDAMTPNALLLVMSSIDLASARGQIDLCAQRGLRYVDAPVSGGERGSREANLSIMTGGEPAAFAAAHEVLSAMGRPILVGPAGSGQLTKLVNQVIVALTITAVAESLLLAEAGGVDLHAVREALLGGFAASAIMQSHALRMIEEDFKPGGPAKHQLKDLRAALVAAQEFGVDMPQLRWVERLFDEFVNKNGGADLDHSAVIKQLRIGQSL